MRLDEIRSQVERDRDDGADTALRTLADLVSVHLISLVELLAKTRATNREQVELRAEVEALSDALLAAVEVPDLETRRTAAQLGPLFNEIDLPATEDIGDFQVEVFRRISEAHRRDKTWWRRAWRRLTGRK